MLRPMVREITITKHFEKDLKDKEERDDIIHNILSSDVGMGWINILPYSSVSFLVGLGLGLWKG